MDKVRPLWKVRPLGGLLGSPEGMISSNDETADPRKEERKSSFIIEPFPTTKSSLSSPFSEGGKHLKILHKSLQDLNLTLTLCCDMNARPKERVHTMGEDHGVKV